MIGYYIAGAWVLFAGLVVAFFGAVSYLNRDPDAARPLPGAHYQPATYRDDAGHEAWIRSLTVDFEPEEGKR